MGTTKPTVFIGSSAEGLPYANAVFAELERASEPTVWDQDVFEPMRSSLDALEQAFSRFDFAVLVFTPDDVRTSRRRRTVVPRDNVIIELGMFFGALGRERVFFLTPREKDVRLPTDLLGVTPCEYAIRSDLNVRASVRTACQVVTKRMLELGPRPDRLQQSAEVAFWHNLAERRSSGEEVPSLIGRSRNRVFISGIALNYVAQNCKVQIAEALERGVLVEIVLATQSEVSIARYARFTSLQSATLPLLDLAYERYEQLVVELSTRQRLNFGVYSTEAPMSHSIGLYDETLYISEFCLDADASDVPSYRIPKDAPSFGIFLKEIRLILSEARPIFGLESSRIVQGL